VNEIEDLRARAAELEDAAEALREEADRLWWVEEHARRKREGYEPSGLERMMLDSIRKSQAFSPPLLPKLEWLESHLPEVEAS
jgi:hypothetical protein